MEENNNKIKSSLDELFKMDEFIKELDNNSLIKIIYDVHIKPTISLGMYIEISPELDLNNELIEKVLKDDIKKNFVHAITEKLYPTLIKEIIVTQGFEINVGNIEKKFNKYTQEEYEVRRITVRFYFKIIPKADFFQSDKYNK